MKKTHTILSILGYVTVFAFYFFLAYILWNLNIALELIDLSSFSLSRKTEIVQFKDPASKNIFKLAHEQEYASIYFVISNPPENKDSLLSLVSKHFQSFAPSDTIEKYIQYRHCYYKENTFTNRNHKEKNKDRFASDYLRSRKIDLLIQISVDPESNEQEIVFYEKGDLKEIIWKEK